MEDYNELKKQYESNMGSHSHSHTNSSGSGTKYHPNQIQMIKLVIY